MKVNTVRTPLRRAAEEIDEAREKLLGDEHDAYLDGAARQLAYYVDGDTTEPEARVRPPPGALDSIQKELTDAIQETDGPATEHLRNARQHLLMAIMTLDKQQNQGPPSNE